MKVINFDDENLDKLEEKELNNNKYKKRNKKINDSFKFEDLLSIEQRKRILKYMNE